MPDTAFVFVMTGPIQWLCNSTCRWSGLKLYLWPQYSISCPYDVLYMTLNDAGLQCQLVIHFRSPGLSRNLTACSFCKTMPACRAIGYLKHSWEHSAQFHAQDLPQRDLYRGLQIGSHEK